jgi:hypothetical protein
MKTGNLIVLAAGYCLSVWGINGADAFSMPRGLTTAKIGAELKTFVATHKDLQTDTMGGSTNINTDRTDQTVASVKRYFDPELGTLGTASTSLAVRNFVFKKGQLTEATLLVSGNPEYLRRIQKSVVADCYHKYGSNCVQSVREEKVAPGQRVKLLSFTWQMPTHYIVIACPPLSETNELAATTAIFCLETNNETNLKWLAGDKCTESERQELFKPFLAADAKPKL